MLHSFIIVLPMLICLFWLVSYLCSWKNSYPAKRFMSAFYMAAFVLYACHWVYFSGVRSPYFETLYGIANLSVFPLFLYYIVFLAGERLGKLWLLLIPPSVIMVVYPVCFIDGLEGAQHYFYIFYIFARVCFAFQVVFVWIYGRIKLQKLVKRLDDYFTDNRSSSLRSLHVLIWLFGITAVFAIIWNFLGRERFSDTEWVALPSVLMSILLYALGYVCFILSNPLNGMKEEDDEINHSEEPETLIKRVNELMEKEKVFLREDLTIADVALMAGTNRTYLSTAINSTYSVNFSTYINRYRINEAKKILSSRRYIHDKEAISDAVSMSGFTNEQTFYRVFKEQTGQTPLLYRRLQIS